MATTNSSKWSKTGYYMVVVCDSGKWYNAIWACSASIWQFRKCNVRGEVFNNVSEMDVDDDMMIAYLAQAGDPKKKLRIVRTEKVPA